MTKIHIITMTGYTRVSTKAEAQLTSFENQPEYFKTVLKQKRFRDTYRPTKEFYCDYGQSGTKLNRKGFIKMLEDAGLDVKVVELAEVPHPVYPDRKIKQLRFDVEANPNKTPKFEEIWVKTTSRFARNINAYQILQTLRLKGVYVYFISLDMSTRNPDNLPIIREKLNADMAYSEQLSRQMRIAQEQFEENNRLKGCPYGYDYHPKKKGAEPYYTINPEKGAVVKEIFDLCIDGLGAKAISRTLKDEGILSSTGKPFGTSTIQRILTNEKYMGLNTSGKYTTGTVFEKLSSPTIRKDYKERLAEKGELLPAIVTPEIWYRAQDCMQERKVVKPHNSTTHSYGLNQPKHKLKDLLVCGQCGSHFIVDNNGGRPYYKCSTKRNQGVEVCNCVNVFAYAFDAFIQRLQEGELYAIIKQDFENTIQSIVFLIEHSLSILKDPSKDTHKTEETLKLKAELDRKVKAKNNLIEMADDPIFADNPDTFRGKMLTLESDIKAIREQLTILGQSQEEQVAFLQRLFSVAFEEVQTVENAKEIYTQDEVYDLLDSVKVFGTTENYKGGKPPRPILLAVPKITLQAQGLQTLGFEKFSYRIRNKYPDYETPEDTDNLHILDRDDLTVATKKKAMDETTKSQWPLSESKYLFADTNFNPDLGIEGLSILTQLKDYLHNLYDEFLSISKTQ